MCSTRNLMVVASFCLSANSMETQIMTRVAYFPLSLSLLGCYAAVVLLHTSFCLPVLILSRQASTLQFVRFPFIHSCRIISFNVLYVASARYRFDEGLKKNFKKLEFSKRFEKVHSSAIVKQNEQIPCCSRVSPASTKSTKSISICLLFAVEKHQQ